MATQAGNASGTLTGPQALALLALVIGGTALIIAYG